MMIGEKLMGKDSNYPCTLKVTGQVCENKQMMTGDSSGLLKTKKDNININHNLQQLSSP